MNLCIYTHVWVVTSNQEEEMTLLQKIPTTHVDACVSKQANGHILQHCWYIYKQKFEMAANSICCTR